MLNHNANATKLRLLAVLPILALASACAQVPQSPTAGPGQTDASPDTAGQIFNAMCLTSGPDFAGAPQAAANFPFTYNTTFGTYYHNVENLSVKLLGDPTQTCSIVFVTPADPAAAFARMERVINTINPTDDSTVTVNASRTADGKNILNARINAQ